MRPIHYLLFVLCCMCAVVLPVQAVQTAQAAQSAQSVHSAQAKAAADENAAFFQPEIVPPVWDMDPLRVYFKRDEAKCRKAYGDQWSSACFMALGTQGALAAGVVLRGDALPAGEWRWDDYETLTFTPKTSWKENSNFIVDISKLTLPLRARLSSRTFKGSTLPLAGQSAKGEVWIDPSVSGERAVSFALRFTAPVGKSLEKDIVLEGLGNGPNDGQSASSVVHKGASKGTSKKGNTTASGNTGTSENLVPRANLGKPQVIWGQDGTSCLVKIPLLALPDTDTALTLHVRGVRPVSINNANKASLLAGNLKSTVTVPGKKQLFQVTKAELKVETTKALSKEYQLMLKTSLRVPAAELLKALKVVELPRVQNPEATIPYNWSAAPTVTADDIANARPLKVELLNDSPSASAVGESLVLRVPATSGSYVYCLLPAGFGPAGYTLAAPWAAVFAALPPEGSVSFLQPGNVLTLTPGGDNRLDIVSSGVDAVHWRATRVQPDAVNLMQILTPDFDRFRVQDTVDMAGSAVEGIISLPAVKEGDLSPRFSTLALTELMRGGTGFMQVELQGKRGGETVHVSSRLVLATDLGMVSKLLPSGGRQVFVCSLSSGAPLQDVTVRILGVNGQSVAEARTDAAGRAVLPAVRGLTREKTPVALIASRDAKGTHASMQAAAQGSAQPPAKAHPQAAVDVRPLAQDAAPALAQDMTWMSLDDYKRRVDYSRFPTQGQISSPDNINAYVFGQRGVFRPGETLRFGFVIRRGDWKTLPPDMPLVATLHDPAGRVAMQRTFTVGEGLAELSWLSSEFSPTGRYRMDVTTPGSGASGHEILGTGAVRVEEFQPDTMAIRADLVTRTRPADAGDSAKPADSAASAEPRGWLVTSAAQGVAVDSTADKFAGPALAVYLRNFYGMPAEGRKVKAELSVRPATLRFAGFEDFTFPDILPLGKEAEAATATLLPETLTTAEGQAMVPLPLSAYQNRTLWCRVLVEGFEVDGGRAVSTEKSFLVSPLPVMLGYRPAGAVSVLDYVPQGTKGGLEFVALSPDLRPAGADSFSKVSTLHLSVAERRYVTVLATDAQGKYVYEESPVDKEISGGTARVDANSGQFTWDMPTDRPGEFLLTVRDGERVMARIPYTVAGNDDVRLALHEKSDAVQSTQLRLRLDKNDYAPGDTVNIFMAAPYAGVGLITLERDSVAAHAWFKAEAGHSVHSLTIPKDFEGRGYINVTMGRAITSPEIFMQPHSYAVAPLTVNVSGRDMGLALGAPPHVLPGGVITARLTARYAGKALIFAVDEGVLQLTRFATPEPLRYLLLDRALEVQTDQLFDLLMPVHSQLAKRLPAFGGDMHLGGGRFHNPFKRRNEPPLSWWSGVVDVPASRENNAQNGQYVDVNIPVPVYTNGQVRIMAVAVSPETTGSAQASTVARAPLVLTPQLPLMVAPGDVFEGGVSLHNTTTASLMVALSIEASSLSLEKKLADKVEIAAGKEVFLPLRAVAAQEPGEAALTVLANIVLDAAKATGDGDKTGQKQEFRRTATLSVRPAVLPRQEQQTGFIPALTSEQGKQRQLPTTALDRALYTFKADAFASVSGAPLPPLRVLLRSLAAYPYDCVEQSISRAFPLVLLQRRASHYPTLAAALTPPEINGKPRAEAHAAMQEHALSAIRSAYHNGEYGSGGGMAPWPEVSHVSELLTAYAGDYLLSLREAGLALPGELATSYFITLQESVITRPESLPQCREQAYKLWVLTRSGVVTTSWLETLREHMAHNWQGWENDVTGTLMAGSYALMNMHGPAQEILNAGGEGQLVGEGAGESMSRMAAQSLHVAVLARNFPERLKAHAEELATRLVEGVSSARGSTLEAALGARALLELAAPLTGTKETAGNLTGVELRCTAYQQGFEPVPQAEEKGIPVADMLSRSAAGCTQFSVTAPAKTPLYFEVSSDGYDRTPPAKAVNNGMEVTRRIVLPDGSELAPLVKGEAFAEVTQGTVLRVELSARVFGSGEQPTQVVLADLLPGGFELVLRHPGDVIPKQEDPKMYTRLDRREDRVIAHTAVGAEPQTFVYHLRAVNRGRYALPAAYGEGLYDRSVNSHTAAGVITVQ